MTEVVVLGSGTPNPDPLRCGSGVALDAGAGWLLVDCGRGITQRALQAGLDPVRLAAVFLTHHHTDHVSDLATLAVTRWVAGGGSLPVIAAAGPAARYASRCLDVYEDSAFHGQAPPEAGRRPVVEVTRFGATGELATVFVGAGWTVSSVLVHHPPMEAAVGYRFDDGSHVVAVSGDTAVADGVRRLTAGADLLLHEAVRGDLVQPAALVWNASARSVGELAAATSVPRLVLTHLLPAPVTPGDVEAFGAEVRSGGYTGELTVATDLDRYRLRHGDGSS